jgi:hypothetical protein
VVVVTSGGCGKVSVWHTVAIAGDLYAIVEAHRRLPIERVLGSANLRRFIPCRCRELKADKSTSGDRGGADGVVDDQV